MYIVTTSSSITCMCGCLHRDTGLCLAPNMLLSCRNILAVVGPPNSGKSTLVAALSGRLYKPAKLTGQICISGREKYESFKPTWFSANDVLTSHLTVHQYLVYKGSFLLLQSSRPLLCMSLGRCIAASGSKQPCYSRSRCSPKQDAWLINLDPAYVSICAAPLYTYYHLRAASSNAIMIVVKGYGYRNDCHHGSCSAHLRI